MTNQILQSVIEDPSATITQIEQPLTHESIGLRETDFAMFVCESPAIYFPGKQIYKDNRLNISSGNLLPHWELESVIYHVCFRLADAVPVTVQKEWLSERNQIAAVCAKEQRKLTEEEKQRLNYLYSEKIEKFLDTGHGSCLLRKNEIADLVNNSLKYNNNIKYSLHAWCIMPNHVHVMFQALEHHTLSEIIKEWKSVTAHAINKLLNQKGQLWQQDYYNHIIRTEEEYCNQINYVWNNPEKAGFQAWEWRWKCIDD